MQVPADRQNGRRFLVILTHALEQWTSAQRTRMHPDDDRLLSRLRMLI